MQIPALPPVNSDSLGVENVPVLFAFYVSIHVPHFENAILDIECKNGELSQNRTLSSLGTVWNLLRPFPFL